MEREETNMTSRTSTTTTNNLQQLPSQDTTEQPYNEKEKTSPNIDASITTTTTTTTTSTSTDNIAYRELTTKERSIIQSMEGSIFVSLMDSSEWDIASAWLQTKEGREYVLELDNSDEVWMTRLEWTLSYDFAYVPLNVIETLCKINPDAAKKKSVIGLELPIHTVIGRELSIDHVRALVAAYPNGLLQQGGDNDDLAIHQICHLDQGTRSSTSYDIINLLLDSSPESLRVPDCDWRLPLHHAAGTVRSLDVMTKFIELYPQALRETDGFGWLPLHYCFDYDNKNGQHYDKKEVVKIVKLFIDSYPESIFITCCYLEDDGEAGEQLFPKELVRIYGDPTIKSELITLLNTYEQQYMISLARDVTNQHYSDNNDDVSHC